MKKRYLLLIALFFIAALATFTNPKQEQHKAALKAKLNTHLQQSADDASNGAAVGWERAGQAFGFMLGGFIVEQAVNNLVSTDDYILFSTTRITWQGEARTIGIGAFGNVFLSGKIDEALENGLLEGR